MRPAGFGAIAAAGPIFFFCAWIVMMFTGVLHDEVGINPFGYVDAMKVTIALWLAAAPLVGTAASARKEAK
ncbi:MAG: hypothetical protein ABIJ48_09270 [Actinomycetota bacterium]